jgi:hypothetical protein
MVRDGSFQEYVWPQADRCKALQTSHDSTSDFMTRFISYFDGEKDPRNLMVVFSILRVPMTEWSIGADAQVCKLECEIWFKSANVKLGTLRCCVQLLSDHIQASTGRSVWHHCTRPQRPFERLYCIYFRLRTLRIPRTARQTGLHIYEY